MVNTLSVVVVTCVLYETYFMIHKEGLQFEGTQATTVEYTGHRGAGAGAAEGRTYAAVGLLSQMQILKNGLPFYVFWFVRS